jgi:hypothetical protein
MLGASLSSYHDDDKKDLADKLNKMRGLVSCAVAIERLAVKE